MSDPFKGPPPDKEEVLDKKAASEAPQESQALTLSELNTKQTASQNALQKNDASARELNDAHVEQSLGKLDISFGGSAGVPRSGQAIPFQPRKSEFASSQLDKPINNYKPLINDFLKETPVDHKEAKISEAALRQLARSREALSNATNTQDAVSDALYLARLYQHMRYIEEAKKAIDLSLGIDPDNYYGHQIFRDLERMHPAELGIAARAVEPQPLTKSNLRKRILSMTGGKVIVLGDLLIDELLEGKPERISREAPVLILEHVDTELIPGGAANTANNIAALGGLCHAIGICGDDEYATKLAGLFDKAHISHSLVKDKSRPTTVKTRILSKSHSFKQQLLRLDRISHEKVSEPIQQEVVARLKQVSANYSAIVLSDYRAGLMTDELIRGCRAIAAESNTMLIVDAQDDFARFQNVTLMTPNQPDAEKAVGYDITDRETLEKAGEELLMITGAQAVLITRGAEGMVLFQQNAPMIELPAFNKSEVFDVTGAGDTVVATMALAIVTGSNFIEAMALGNLAAGIVVKKPGTAVTTQKEMLENLDLLKLDE